LLVICKSVSKRRGDRREQVKNMRMHERGRREALRRYEQV
jgi:hypothetical protein